jgi:DNA-binding response OmpR family regulator
MVRAVRLDDRQVFRFMVIDNGPGIAASQVPMLWNRFQQLETADGTSKGGSGLGLAITKAIVTEHGGTVGVETEPGTGSRFWFDLPVERPVQTDDGADDTKSNQSIFLVDDDDELFDLLNGLLTSAGYELHRARTVAEAARLLFERRPAVLLLNLQLPDGSGFDLVRQMVLKDNAEPLPIVVLSGREPQIHKLGTPILIDWLVNQSNSEGIRAALKRTVRNLVADGGKVLLITETAETRTQLRGILTSLNVACLDYPGSIDSSFLGSETPNLIVLDIACGQQVCFDVFQVLRQEKVQPIPILMYASKELKDEDVDKLTLGFSRHVTKSHMSEPEFLQSLRELLDSRLRSGTGKP